MTQTCFLHVGTHKTGTTSIQTALTAHAARLAGDGLYVPRTGRPDPAGGHHNIAWELNGDERFDPACGTFDDLLEEIVNAGAPRVCLTSEDFEYLHDRPRQLRMLAEGIRVAGYRPVIVLYLRPQAGYAESLYAELVKHGLTLSFDAFLNQIVLTGEFRFNDRWSFTFDYERLLDEFGAGFGAESVVARRFDTHGGDVVDDFLELIGTSVPRKTRDFAPRRLNAGLPFDDVLRRLERNAASCGVAVQPLTAAPALRAGGRFDPVHLLEVRRIVRRFNAGNRRNHERFGVSVPCVSGHDLIGDILAALKIDPASTVRRRLVDAQTSRLTRSPGAPPPPNRRRRRHDAARRAFESTRWGIGRAAAAVRGTAPARIESVVVCTSIAVAVAAFVCGAQNGSTALVEFGMLCAIVGASAAGVVARRTADAHGIVSDEMFFADWGRRLRAAGFALVGVYALVNALLDIGLARHTPDSISVLGTIAAAVATFTGMFVLPAKRRLIKSPLPASAARDDRLYTICGYVMVLVEILHAVSSAWWLETSVDIAVALFAVGAAYRLSQVGAMRARPPASRLASGV